MADISNWLSWPPWRGGAEPENKLAPRTYDDTAAAHQTWFGQLVARNDYGGLAQPLVGPDPFADRATMPAINVFSEQMPPNPFMPYLMQDEGRRAEWKSAHGVLSGLATRRLQDAAAARDAAYLRQEMAEMERTGQQTPLDSSGTRYSIGAMVRPDWWWRLSDESRKAIQDDEIEQARLRRGAR